MKRLPALFDGPAQLADHPLDREFKKVIEQTEGMATENKLAVLDLAASMMEEGEVFVEVGTFRGTSIIGAAMRNSSRSFIAIDNFSQFGGSEEECLGNLRRFNCSNVGLINDDAWSAIERGMIRSPVGVYFYDGEHTFDQQWRALDMITTHLSDRALVVIDDTDHPPAFAATRCHILSDPRYSLLYRFKSPYNGEPRWWNGVAILAFNRATGSSETQTMTKLLFRLYGFRYGRGYDFIRLRIKPVLRVVVREALKYVRPK